MQNNFSFLIIFLVIFGLASCSSNPGSSEKASKEKPLVYVDNIIPRPVSVQKQTGSFTITNSTILFVETGNAEIKAVGTYLSGKLSPSMGFTLPVVESAVPSNGNIYMTTNGGDPSLGDEGYQITVSTDSVLISAFKPAGLFYAAQTIRQMLPQNIEMPAVQSGPWTLEASIIIDKPRFEWRGAMLDVARHFFSVQDVKKYIDYLVSYKINRLHLHLADDQGWRIMINSWPNLALFGGSSAVGGDPGGYYTQADYTEIVNYALSNYMIVIPEIDMPGHVNAALSSYSNLNPNNIPPAPRTDTLVGYSCLDLTNSNTFVFLNDVISEICAITPGPYFHIGGDEANTLKTNIPAYSNFVAAVLTNVQSHGKRAIGWEEIAQSSLYTNSIAQHWWTGNLAKKAVTQGAKVIMSTASRTYMDMQYNPDTTLGQNWAGYIEVQDAYSWEPSTEVSGVDETNILGVEAPLWTEYIKTISDIEYMAFPRIACYAELGWSEKISNNWDNFKLRLATHGKRFSAMGINYYQSPQVPWIK
jgi:hexosaminidase